MVFSLGCLKKSLLALVALSLLISIGQLVLIFVNNKVFGAVMFVVYILFFLAILLALCRDSVSMYAASFVLLVVFVISCSLIQSYNVPVKDLIKLDSGGATNTRSMGRKVIAGRHKRAYFQDMPDDPQWKMETPAPTWEQPEGLLPVLPAEPIDSDTVEQMEPRQGDNNFDIEPAPPLPAQPTDQPTELTEMATVYPTDSLDEIDEPPATKAAFPKGLKEGEEAKPADTGGSRESYNWAGELRWVSNVLGVLHILMISCIVCLLYEMLFGGRYRYRTWC